jgi:glycosyltransferase involved in cell wall biosynthesis
MLATERHARGTDEGTSRVFVDVTTSLMFAGEMPIGILRVEGEIARRLLRSADPHTIAVVFRNDGLLLALSPEQTARIFATRVAGSEEIRVHVRRAPAVPVEQPAASPPRWPLVVRARLRMTGTLRRVARAFVAGIPNAVRGDVRAILVHVRQIARTIIYRNPVPVPVPVQPTQSSVLREEIMPTLRAVVHPRPGDVLITAGLYSNLVPLRAMGELRARIGLRVVTICYDLIRVTHPQFNPASMGTELFVADAVALLDTSDLVLAISEWTRRELVAFAARSGRNVPAVQVVRLGSDIGVRGAEVPVGSPLPLDLVHRRFALAVGTVEPRKNYGLLLRVWERLVADPKFTLDLVIVGRQGFDAADSISEVEGCPLFGSRIVWLESCPDDALLRLYEACHFVLCPSFVEGWGLPVTEALTCGRHVIASDRGAMREASLGLGQLLDPEDEEAWAAAIAQAAAAPRVEVALPEPPRWDTAAAAVETCLRRLMTVREPA